MLDLYDIDEVDVLDRFETLPELLRTDTSAGQYELVPGSAQPASVWYPDCIGDKAGDPIPEWWEPDPTILCSPLLLFHARHVFFAPRLGAVITSSGGVMKRTVAEARFHTPDLARLPHAVREDGRMVLRPPSDLPNLPAGVVSMPWGATKNYAHFLCDCLSSLAVLANEPHAKAYPRLFPPLNSWQRRHLELLGVAPVELDQPLYRISDVLFTSGMDYFVDAPNINYRSVRDLQLPNKRPTDIVHRKVYITRAPITQAYPNRRRFLSEAALEEQMRALGFAVVATELLEVDEEIDVFRNAEIVVACRGAGLANAIYCRPDTTIVEVVATVPDFHKYRWVRDICAIVGCRWRPYFCAGAPAEQPIVGLAGEKRLNLGFTFDVDIPDLIAFIERTQAND